MEGQSSVDVFVPSFVASIQCDVVVLDSWLYGRKPECIGTVDLSVVLNGDLIHSVLCELPAGMQKLQGFRLYPVVMYDSPIEPSEDPPTMCRYPQPLHPVLLGWSDLFKAV